MTFVSPVNSVILDCSSNILPNAITLADVDMNKSNELLVGTQDGELLIFKAVRSQNNAQLWRRAHGLGFITAVAVGSVAMNSNEPRPVICVANAEGAIHLFVLRLAVQRNRVRSAGGILHSGSRNDSKVQLHSSNSSTNDDEQQQQQQQQQIQVAFSQQLVCNPKMLLIQDYNENEKQLIIGYSDRCIRVFTSVIVEEFDGRLSGRFALKHVFNVAGQIHTLTARRLSTRDYELIVSQPYGNLLRFNPNEDNGQMFPTNLGETKSMAWTEAVALDKFRDEVVYATVCHDHLYIFSSQLDEVLHKIPMNTKKGHLCGLQKGPVSKDNHPQLVAISSVDGDTFIVDHHLNIVRFRLPLSPNTGCSGGIDSIDCNPFLDQIQAFTAGTFGDNNAFCFIYALTHNDKIIIVHSIETSNTQTSNLSAALDEKLHKAGLSMEHVRDLLHPAS